VKKGLRGKDSSSWFRSREQELHLFLEPNPFFNEGGDGRGRKQRNLSRKPSMKIERPNKTKKEKKMEKMWTLIKKFVKEEEGMETVEYAVVAALVVVVAIAVWTSLGNAISSKISELTSHINS
jgi:Flp pilus assembly pilin Flp